MTTVRTNVLANLAGQGWSAFLQLLLLPLYIHFLGVEAYGIVSLYVVLITSVQIFDLGLAQTLNRELARWRGLPERTAEVRDLVRTVEIVYWAIIAAVCAALLVLATAFIGSVLHPQHLDADAVAKAVALMIAVVALQWPVTLYQSGLMGLQHQISANVLRIVLSTLAGAGAILTLWLVAPTIVAFFAWQIIAGVVAVAWTAYVFHARLPAANEQPRFRPELLKGIWRFAAGVSGLTISAVVLTQMDKWLLVNILTLEAFGYYALAWTAAGALNLLTAPIFAAIFPRFSTLIVSQERRILINVYQVATQAMATAIFPLAIFISLFSHEVLLLWTGNPDVARNSGPMLSLLVIGTALNGLAYLPYAWELARGRTRFVLTINGVLILLLVPSIWYFANRYGAIAAAALWVAMNIIYLLVFIPVVHRALEPKDRLQWLFRDIGLPLSVSAVILGALRIVLPANMSKLAMAIALGAALIACFAAAALSSRNLMHALRRTDMRQSGIDGGR